MGSYYNSVRVKVQIRDGERVGQGNVVWEAMETLQPDDDVSIEDLMDAAAATTFDFTQAEGYGVDAHLYTGDQGASWASAEIVVQLLDGIQSAGWEVLLGLVVTAIKEAMGQESDE